VIPFGVFYQSDRPTKNALEKKWIESSREKNGNASDLQLLQKFSTLASPLAKAFGVPPSTFFQQARRS
jgi:hypothetical protein